MTVFIVLRMDEDSLAISIVKGFMDQDKAENYAATDRQMWVEEVDIDTGFNIST